MKIQDIPNTDSPNNDPFEAIVELYYQSIGYVTSSGKWFWVFEDEKKQRGYQDIDVLAINATEVIIVSVTSNLDDKLRQRRDGTIDDDMLKKIKSYFFRVEQYFNSVNEYKWLISKERKIRKVVAYNHAYKNASNVVIPTLLKSRIDVLSADDMLTVLIDYIKSPNIRIKNPILRTIQLIEFNQKIKT